MLHHDGTLQVDYLSKSVSYPAGEVHSLSFEHKGFGRNFYSQVRIDLADGRSVRIYGFDKDNVIIYKSLESWHEKYT